MAEWSGVSEIDLKAAGAETLPDERSGLQLKEWTVESIQHPILGSLARQELEEKLQSPHQEKGDLSSSGDLEEIKEREDGKNDQVLQFMDSLDAYLTLLDSLSGTLRQGWFELASARHSMGSSRISSVVFDLKEQYAATTLHVSESVERPESESLPLFALYKWASLRNRKLSSEEMEISCAQKINKNSELRHRGSSGSCDDTKLLNSKINLSPTTSDGNVRKERSKLLSVFGALVSPKLRAAQVSFETALDGIVEIANVRSSMLSAFSQLQQEMKDSSSI